MVTWKKSPVGWASTKEIPEFSDSFPIAKIRRMDPTFGQATFTSVYIHRIHVWYIYIYMLTFGVYWWDPCYHIYPYIAYMDPMQYIIVCIYIYIYRNRPQYPNHKLEYTAISTKRCSQATNHSRKRMVTGFHSPERKKRMWIIRKLLKETH